MRYTLARFGASNGTKTWEYNFGGNTGTAVEAATSVDWHEGFLYATGFVVHPTSLKDFLTVKLVDSSGSSSTWATSGDGTGVRRWNGPASRDDFGNDIEVVGAGNVYVTGASSTDIDPPPTDNSSLLDYATIAYNPGGGYRYPQGTTNHARTSSLGSEPGSAGYDESFSVGIAGVGNTHVVGIASLLPSTGNPHRDYLAFRYLDPTLAASSADTLTPDVGIIESGGLASLTDSENNSLHVLNDYNPNADEFRASIIVEGLVPSSVTSASELCLFVESRADAPPLWMGVYFCIFYTGNWELQHWINATSADSFLELRSKGDPEKYISPSPRRVRAKISYYDAGSSGDPWGMYVDWVQWQFVN